MAIAEVVIQAAIDHAILLQQLEPAQSDLELRFRLFRSLGQQDHAGAKSLLGLAKHLNSLGRRHGGTPQGAAESRQK